MRVYSDFRAQEMQEERATGHNELGRPFLRSLRGILDTTDITFTSYQRTACPKDEDVRLHAEEPAELEDHLVRSAMQSNSQPDRVDEQRDVLAAALRLDLSYAAVDKRLVCRVRGRCTLYICSYTTA